MLSQVYSVPVLCICVYILTRGCDMLSNIYDDGHARGVGNERNLIHLVEKSVEIKLKS